MDEVFAAQLATQRARLAAFQEITMALGAVRTPEEIAGVVMAQGSRALGASSGLIRLLSEDGAWLEPLEASGYRPDPLITFGRIGVSDPTPHGDALRSRLPVWLGSEGEMEAHYQARAAPLIRAGYRATATLPLLIEARSIGTVGFGFQQPRAFEPDERDFIQAIAGLTVQALERVRLYAAAQARAQAAEELAHLRSDFLASVSHELRTPLAAVVGYGELLQARWTDLPEARRQAYLQRILLSANRQVRLVEDLLLMAMGDLGSLPLDRRNVALADLARQAAEEVHCSYPDQVMDLAGPAELMVVADRERVVQVLANVLDNAAKHSPVGSAVLLRWGQEEGLAAVRIYDHGPGIPEQHRAKLFTPFGRLPESRMRAGRVGTGLGLYLGRRLTEAMGGKLDLEETGAGGTTFRMCLPLAAGPSNR